MDVMMKYYGIGLFFISLWFCGTFSYRIDGDNDPKELNFPDEYHFKGETIFLMSNLNEPFEMWYSRERNRSRVDYYNGTFSMIYYGENDNITGSLYEIHFESSMDLESKRICSTQFHEEEAENFLPETWQFLYVGTETVDGSEMHKWMSETEDESENERTKTEVWAVYPNDEDDFAIPIKIVMSEYDTWKGELTKHNVMNFYNYYSTFDDEIFDAESYDCAVFNEDGIETVQRNLKFPDPENDEHVDQAFHHFKVKHDRKYEDKNEHGYRRRVFRNNLQHIVTTNRQNKPYKLAVNQFADLTLEEMRSYTGLLPSRGPDVGTEEFPYTEDEVDHLVKSYPKNYDMRLEGYITPIRDQMNCGSCWAFASVAAVEGALARLLEGRQIRLSEQSLIDCGWAYGNAGCDGGMILTAMMYLLDNGVPTTEDYGLYTKRDGYCHMKNMTKVHKIKGFVRVQTSSENALKVATYKHGPVVVAIHASQDLFLYDSGIFYDVECNEDNSLNHAVTVIGYGERYGESYWLIKNSYGANWGEDGFLRLSAINNNCDTERMPYYVIL